MAGKQPAFMFYTGDWLKDPKLSQCSPATRGVWMDLLCAMHEDGRVGELSGTAEGLARICRCSPADLTSALDDLAATGAADVTERNGRVTVVSRRMQREAKERKSAAHRQKEKRQSDRTYQERNCHGSVTETSRPPLSVSSSISVSPEKKEKRAPPLVGDVERLYAAYPKKVGKGDAMKAIRSALGKVEFGELLAAVEEFASAVSGANMQFVPYPATWFNQERWKDDRKQWATIGRESSRRTGPVVGPGQRYDPAATGPREF